MANEYSMISIPERYGLGIERPSSGPRGRPFSHEIGSRIQIFPDMPVSRVLDRRHGGFGAVYICEEEGSGLRHAFKTPRSDRRSSADLMEEFASEAAIWWSLPSHASILSAHRVMRYNGFPYIHIEYVKSLGKMSPDLGSVILSFADSPLTREYLGSVSIFIAQTLDALSFLEDEDASFLHGDIKPSNILVASKVTDDGTMLLTGSKLTDFGMSNFRTVERKGFYLGDSYYLAPEVYVMAPDSVKDLDFAARKALDVYALGCTAFETMFRSRWQVLFDDSRVPVTLRDLGTDLQEIARNSRDAYFSEVVECVSTWLDGDPQSRPATYRAMLDQWIETMRRNGIDVGWVKVPTASPGTSGYPPLHENSIYLYLKEKGYDSHVASQVTQKLFAGGSLRSAGKLKEADELFDDVLDLIQGFPPALSAKATSLLIQRDCSAAARLFGQAATGYSEDADLVKHDLLGFGATLMNFSQALAELPGSEMARVAVDVATAGLGLLPSDARSHFSLAKAQLRVNNISAASNAVERGLEIDLANKFGRSLLCAVILSSDHSSADLQVFAPDELRSGGVMVSLFARLRADDMSDK